MLFLPDITCADEVLVQWLIGETECIDSSYRAFDKSATLQSSS